MMKRTLLFSVAALIAIVLGIQAVALMRKAVTYTGFFVYDDPVTGVRLTTSKPDWIVMVENGCAPSLEATCWHVLNPDTSARISLLQISLFEDSNEGKALEEAMRTLRSKVLDGPARGRISAMSDGVVFKNGDAAMFSYTLPDDGGRRFHAGFVRSPADPRIKLLFMAGSMEAYAAATERDFRKFLEDLSAVPEASP